MQKEKTDRIENRLKVRMPTFDKEKMETTMKRTIEFYRHNLDDECRDKFLETSKGLFLTTGPLTAEFERAFAEYLGLPSVAGTMSCTHSLHLAYRALGIGPGDEVIVPAFTFVATVNAVIHAGATPVLAEVDAKTGLIDPSAIENVITKRTKAVSPVHLYGLMAPMNEISAIARKHNLLIIEDAAHAVESKGPGFGPGTLSDAVAFSFYATKNITCGEGGALGMKDAELDKKVRSLRNHGQSKNAIDRFDAGIPSYDVALLGFKSNLNDLQASLLLPQLSRIEERLERRQDIVNRYNEGLGAIDGLITPLIPKGYRSAHHLYTINVVDAKKRDKMIAALRNEGVNCSINYRPLSDLTFVREELGMKPEDFPNATALGNSTLTLPLYPLLTDDEVEYVIEATRNVAGKIL